MPMQANVSGLSADPSAAQAMPAGSAAEATAADCTKRRRESRRDTDTSRMFSCVEHRYQIIDI
jgi:hypothetical protein